MMSSGSPETRGKILTAAWALLEEAEGGEVRMADVARRAGVSRQGLYLHFPTRGDLLDATTCHIDEVKDVDRRLAESRAAETGEARLAAFIAAWGDYIPEIYGVAKALLRMKDRDAAARRAWEGRMDCLREGCQAAVEALERDGRLSPAHTPAQAVDILWTLLSVRAWEHLTIDCGWPQATYIAKTRELARKILVR